MANKRNTKKNTDNEQSLGQAVDPASVAAVPEVKVDASQAEAEPKADVAHAADPVAEVPHKVRAKAKLPSWMAPKAEPEVPASAVAKIPAAIPATEPDSLPAGEANQSKPQKDAKAESDLEPWPGAKSEAKPAVSDPSPEAKPAVSDPSPEAKPAKPEPCPETKTEPRPETKPEPCPEAEPAPRVAPVEAERVAGRIADSGLLGAPILDDDGALDDLLRPTAAVETPKEKVHPLAGIVGGFTAPLHIEPKAAEPAPRDAIAPADSAKPKVRQTTVAPPEKLKDEIEHLTSIIEAVESLEYLKPRMKKIALSGCELADLVGLYRMVSQVLLENMRSQLQATRQMRDRYEKKLRQVVVDKSAEFVKMVADGKMPSKEERQTAEAPSEGANLFFRKQLEIKDQLLLRAREAQMEAEARCEKITNDVANIRQRQAKDIALQMQKARESLFVKILPTLDSFDSALAASENFVDVASVVDGLGNIHRQLLDACASEGLQPIEAKGQPFDPSLHEAMGYVPCEDIPEDCVCADLRRGYMLNDKLLRATMVQVAKKSEG